MKIIYSMEPSKEINSKIRKFADEYEINKKRYWCAFEENRCRYV